MASDEILDFAKLLAPIPGDNRAGVDLQEDPDHDSIFRRIRSAAGEARRIERTVDYDEDGNPTPTRPGDWRPVLKHAPQALAEQSKDLRIVAVLIEALLRRHGYAGLRDAFRLAAALIADFWDDLYPLPNEEEGILARVSPLAGLNGEGRDGLLVGPIAKVPITEGRTVGPYTLLDFTRASRLEGIQDPEVRARQAQQDGAVTVEMFNVAVQETSDEFFHRLWDDVSQCSGEFKKLCEVLEQMCGKDEVGGYSLAPASSRISNALQECRETVQRIAGHVLGPPEQEEAPPDGSSSKTPDLQPSESSPVAGQLQSREEAFGALQRAADFFRRTEPHSPVSYALEQVVRWGKMPLPELLKELIPEESARDQLFKHVGIRISEQEE